MFIKFACLNQIHNFKKKIVNGLGLLNISIVIWDEQMRNKCIIHVTRR